MLLFHNARGLRGLAHSKIRNDGAQNIQIAQTDRVLDNDSRYLMYMQDSWGRRKAHISIGNSNDAWQARYTRLGDIEDGEGDLLKGLPIVYIAMYASMQHNEVSRFHTCIKTACLPLYHQVYILRLYLLIPRYEQLFQSPSR